MAATYTTAQIDAVVQQLEAALGQGFVRLRKPDGGEAEYRSAAEIRNALTYWKSLYATASDAPTTVTAKVRTYRMYGGKGFSV